MKKMKVVLGILMLPALVACLACPAFGTASLMNITWDGKWFKLTTSSSGYYYPNAKGGIGSYKDKSIMYLRIDSIDDVNKTATLTQCNYEGSAWSCDVGGGAFNYIGDNPNPLDFLVYEYFCNTEGTGEYCMAYTARIKGKLNKTGVLTSGTITCIGSLEWDTDTSYNDVGKGSFSGTLVPVSKLPFPAP